MPFYHLLVLASNRVDGTPARLVCPECGAEPTLHSGRADMPDLPIQLRCDRCLLQCADFLTTEERDREIAAVIEQAETVNGPITLDQPKYGQHPTRS